MDEYEVDFEVRIENSDGSPVTVTDVLREIARSQPRECPHVVVARCRRMGLWIAGDPVTVAELRALQQG